MEIKGGGKKAFNRGSAARSAKHVYLSPPPAPLRNAFQSQAPVSFSPSFSRVFLLVLLPSLRPTPKLILLPNISTIPT